MVELRSFDAAISDDITSMSTDLIFLYEIFSTAICGRGTLMWQRTAR